MAEPNDLDFYIGVLPKHSAVNEHWIRLLGQKLRHLRLSILSESSKALGRSSLSTESARTLETYLEDIRDSTQFWLICCVFKPGMQGNIFQPASWKPMLSMGDLHCPTPNSDDEFIMARGTWIGLINAYGPIPIEDWTLPSSTDSAPKHEQKFHLSNLYIRKAYRRVTTTHDTTLLESMGDVFNAHIANHVRSSSLHFPVNLRKRLIVSPENVAQSSLIKRYQKYFGYVLTGWVPKVTALVVNRTRVDIWPKPEEDPQFYAQCDWAVLETVERVDRLEVGSGTQRNRAEGSRL